MNIGYKEVEVINKMVNNAKSSESLLTIYVKNKNTFYGKVEFDHVFKVNPYYLQVNDKDWTNEFYNPSSDVIINDDKFGNDTAYGILRFLKHDNIGDKFVSSRHYVNILNKEYVIHVLDKEELSEISIELNKEIERLKSISKCLED